MLPDGELKLWLASTGRSGGIGRRAWFRSMYPQGCGGSSPFDGTSFFLVDAVNPPTNILSWFDLHPTCGCAHLKDHREAHSLSVRRNVDSGKPVCCWPKCSR